MPSVTKKKDEEMIWSGRRGQNFFITFVLREEKKSIIISSREKLVSFSQRFTFHSTFIISLLCRQATFIKFWNKCEIFPNFKTIWMVQKINLIFNWFKFAHATRPPSVHNSTHFLFCMLRLFGHFSIVVGASGRHRAIS